MPILPSLGFILSTLQLERGSRTYYGPNDIIKGNVVLEYQPPEKAKLDEVFGPLRVDVVLEGILKVKTYNDNEDTHKSKCDCGACNFRRTDERQLCRRNVTLWNGPIRMKAHTKMLYPFELQFPESPEENVSEQFGPQLLPPSFNAETMILKWEGLAQATYQLLAQVEMSIIDVRVTSRGGPFMLQFEQPGYPPNRITDTKEHMETHRIRSKYLLPEAERTRGFKALFAKQVVFPEFAFSALITSFPKSIDVDQSIAFEVHVVPDKESSSSTIIPDVTIKKCEVILRTIIDIESCGTDKKGRSSKGFGIKTEHLRPQISPDGPFWTPEGQDEQGSQENRGYGQGGSKVISTRPVKGIKNTLHLQNIKRTYEVQLNIELMVADRPIMITLRRLEISVHTPFAPWLPKGGTIIGPEHDAGPSDPALPRYDSLEAPPPKLNDELPPQYDRDEQIVVKEKGTS